MGAHLFPRLQPSESCHSNLHESLKGARARDWCSNHFDISRKSVHEEFIARIPIVIGVVAVRQWAYLNFSARTHRIYGINLRLGNVLHLYIYFFYSGFFISISLSLPVGYKIPTPAGIPTCPLTLSVPQPPLSPYTHSLAAKFIIFVHLIPATHKDRQTPCLSWQQGCLPL